MYVKIFIPVICFLLLQLTGYTFFNQYYLETTLKTDILIYLNYLSLILIIFLFLLSNKANNSVEIKEGNNRVNIIVFLSVLFFLIRPTIVLIGMNIELGADQVRYSIYNSDGVYTQIYGIGILGTFANYYLVPFLWFYCIWLCDKNDRFSKFLFYFIVLILSIYNASYAGRIFIYYAILAIYLRYVLLGLSVGKIFVKYIFILATAIISSNFILKNRNNSNDIGSSDVVQGLIDYHVGGVFFLAQKMQTIPQLLSGDYYLFRTIYEGLFSPFYFLIGKPLGDLTYLYQVGQVLSVPTLYDLENNDYFNAFATLFYYFILDYGVFSPIFVFVIIGWILFTAKVIKDKNQRVKYIAFISLVLYFSLFTGVLFMPGYLLVIFSIPVILFIKSKWFE